MLGAPDDLQPSLVSAAGTTEIAAPFVTRVLLEHGSSPRGLEMRVVMVVMVMVMMMMMMVMMIVEILRQLRIGFALRRLGFVHFLEESERVGDGLEQLREGLGLQEFTHIRGARRCRLRTVQGRDGGYNPNRASNFLLHLIFLPERIACNARASSKGDVSRETAVLMSRVNQSVTGRGECKSGASVSSTFPGAADHESFYCALSLVSHDFHAASDVSPNGDRRSHSWIETMTNSEFDKSSSVSVVALLSRVLMSAIFIWAGFGKLTAAAGTTAYFTKIGLPMPSLVYLLAVAVELGGGILMLVGLFTRPAAVVLGLWCIATAIVGHSDFGDRSMEIHFMKNLTMAGGFAYVVLLGAGALSLDALLGKRRELAAA